MTPSTFRFRQYQKEDLARAALMDGAIFSWDQGLGKTVAAFVWPMLKKARRVLIVSPGSIHRQTIEEGRSKFGIETTPINNQSDALALLNTESLKTENSPSFFITSYQTLGFNGADEWAPKVNERTGEEYISKDTLARRAKMLEDLNIDPTPENVADYFEGVGESREFHIQNSTFKITCLARPTVARLLTDYFDCVVIDEGVRLKASESFISRGVRTLRPQFRLVLTGTPVKNILDDIFWLAHWACGGHSDPTPRWPYEDSDKAKERFANEHLLIERNITQEEEYKARTGKNRTAKKRTPKICNIHRLWKLFGPVIIRRRKDDCGEDIPAKRFVPMRIRPGTAQQAVYQRYVGNKPTASKTGEAVKGTARAAMQLQLLREAALSPDSPHLARASVCGDGPRRSWTDLTPKSAAMLKLVSDVMHSGEQIVVMSPFQHFSRTFAARLSEAGVSHALLDGTVAPEKRGEIAGEFKARKFAVLIGGIESMSEGHSFDQCCHLILPSLVWAMDKNLQAIDRVHRLTSRKDVTIYTFATENTVDVLLESRFQEKKDSAQLALDGRLFAEDHKEINLAELLADAISNFDPSAPTFDETDIEAEWDASLRARLRHAETAWREWNPPILPGHGTTAADIAIESAAIAEIEDPYVPSVPSSSRAAAALARLLSL
jgi:SNF2 family DNA or RNA helicase